MRETPPRKRSADARPPLDGLLCAMVLAPRTYARNRFFRLFELPDYARVRQRAKHVRGLIREVLGVGSRKAEIIGTQVLDDRVLLKLCVQGLNYERTTSLTLLEWSLVNYALCRAEGARASAEDEALVTESLQALGADLPIP